jgi:hypothetical protein
VEAASRRQSNLSAAQSPRFKTVLMSEGYSLRTPLAHEVVIPQTDQLCGLRRHPSFQLFTFIWRVFFCYFGATDPSIFVDPLPTLLFLAFSKFFSMCEKRNMNIAVEVFLQTVAHPSP